MSPFSRLMCSISFLAFLLLFFWPFRLKYSWYANNANNSSPGGVYTIFVLMSKRAMRDKTSSLAITPSTLFCLLCLQSVGVVAQGVLPEAVEVLVDGVGHLRRLL